MMNYNGVKPLELLGRPQPGILVNEKRRLDSHCSDIASLDAINCTILSWTRSVKNTRKR